MTTRATRRRGTRPAQPTSAAAIARYPALAAWLWPWSLWEAGMATVETVVAAPSVVEARLPLMWSAFLNPWLADHRELSLMVTEKTDAFGRSGRVAENIGRKLASVADANARDLGRWSGGAPAWPSEWFRMIERNVDLFANLVATPARAIAPIHAAATANARRLAS